MQGVYVIRNSITGSVYVGSSVKVEVRWKEHSNALRHGGHPNKVMQTDWDKLSAETFSMEFVEQCSSLRTLGPSEQRWVDRFLEEGVPLYNKQTRISAPKLGGYFYDPGWPA